MAAIDVKTADFESKVLQSDKTVIVDFWATWCGPCRMQGPIVEEFGNENPDVVIAKIDVDAEPDLAEKFNIMSIPSLLVFKNGELTAKATGVQTKQKLADLIAQ